MRPVEYVYKQHPWRKPKKGSEAGWILSQFLGEFYSHDFCRVYLQHLAAGGREAQTMRSLHSKLWYHFERGYLIRRGFWNQEWKEWREGREIPVQGSFQAPEQIQEIQNQDQKIEQILASIPDSTPREAEPEPDPTEEALRRMGY